MRASTILFLLGTACQAVAFVPPAPLASVFRGGAVCTAHTHHHDDVGSNDGDGVAAPTSRLTRRSFAEDLVKGSLVGLSLAQMTSSPAFASGGATAGGAYLLSAKQRYNKRVTAGIKAFLTVDERDLGQLNAFFASTEEGGWEDLSAAGYLLANAFRTSSTKAPDALPAVKKWKAFAKDIELLKRALSKKDGEKVLVAYKDAEEKLDAYLAEVELPSGMELKQM